MNTDHKCLPQHAIVQIVQRKKTKGQIVIPEKPLLDSSGRVAAFQQDTAGTEESEYRQRAFLVAASDFYVHQGLKVDVEIPIGAEIYAMDPDATRYGDMPADHFRIHLSRIQLWREVTKEDRERAIAEAAADNDDEPVKRQPNVTLQ